MEFKYSITPTATYWVLSTSDSVSNPASTKVSWSFAIDFSGKRIRLEDFIYLTRPRCPHLVYIVLSYSSQLRLNSFTSYLALGSKFWH